MIINSYELILILIRSLTGGRSTRGRLQNLKDQNHASCTHDLIGSVSSLWPLMSVGRLVVLSPFPKRAVSYSSILLSEHLFDYYTNPLTFLNAPKSWHESTFLHFILLFTYGCNSKGDPEHYHGGVSYINNMSFQNWVTIFLDSTHVQGVH